MTKTEKIVSILKILYPDGINVNQYVKALEMVVHVLEATEPTLRQLTQEEALEKTKQMEMKFKTQAEEQKKNQAQSQTVEFKDCSVLPAQQEVKYCTNCKCVKGGGKSERLEPRPKMSGC